MCFGGKSQSAPTAPTVDPEADRLKAEQEAAAKANEQILADSRRKRQQKNLLSTEDATNGSVLASGAKTTIQASTVLGSGGA